MLWKWSEIIKDNRPTWFNPLNKLVKTFHFGSFKNSFSNFEIDIFLFFPLKRVKWILPLIVLDCVHPQRCSEVAGFSEGSDNSLNRVCQLNMAGLLWSRVEDGCPDWPASGLGTYCTQLVASVDNDKTQACFTLLDKLSAPLTELVAFLLPLSGGVTNPSLCLFYAT